MDKIQNKLLFVLLLVTLLPVLLIGGYSLFSSMRALQENSISTHKSKVALVSERIENYFAGIDSDLFYLRDSNALHLYFGVLKSGNSHSEQLLLTNLRSSLLKFSEQKKIYQQVRFINSDGIEIVRIERDKGVSKNISDTLLQDKSSSDYFVQTLQKGSTLYISPIRLNRENGEIEEPYRPVIHFATSVLDKRGSLQGIVVLNVMLNKVFGFIQEQEKKGEILTFSAPEGDYFYHNDKSKRLGSARDLVSEINLFSDFPALENKIAMVKQLENIETKEGIVTYQSIMLNNDEIYLGNLISIAPKAVVYEPARHFLYVFLGVILLTLLLSFSLALFLSKSITSPLLQLTESIDKLSKGNLETSIEINSNDEIGKLAHAVELLRKSMKILMKREGTTHE